MNGPGSMLEPILEATRRRIELLPPLADLRSRAAPAPAAVDFAAALRRPGLQVIAEFKRRSPSAGPLAPDLDPGQQAIAYAAGGAAAVSVLTEPDFFAGGLPDLEAVRGAVALPVLRKDFVLDPRQVWEARLAGADAVLLITAAVGQDLAALVAVADEAGLAALVEVHDEAEAAAAVAAGASVIGVNNRDLTTFVTDLGVAERVAAAVPPDVVRIAESGVSNRGGARRMAAAGYDAILVGEALMRSSQPQRLIAELRGVA